MPIEIADFRQFEKNTLKGFITARLTTVGLEIRDIAVHERDGQRWIQLPAKPFEKTDGGKGWNYIVSFYEKSITEDSLYYDPILSLRDIYISLDIIDLIRGRPFALLKSGRSL